MVDCNDKLIKIQEENYKPIEELGNLVDNNDYKECENFDQIWLSIIGKVENSVHKNMNIPSLKDMMNEEEERKNDPPQLTENIKKAFTSVDGVFKTYFTTIKRMMEEKIENNGGNKNPHNEYASKFCHIVDDVLENENSSPETETETETNIYNGLKFLFNFKIEVREAPAPAAAPAPADEAPAAAPAPAPAEDEDEDEDEDEEEEEGEYSIEGGSVKNLIERYNEGEDPLKKIIGCIFDIGKYAIDVSSLNKTAFDSIGDNLSELVTRVTPLQGQIGGGGFFSKWSSGQKIALLACCCVFAIGFCILTGGGGVAAMGPGLFYLTQAVTSVSMVVAGGIIVEPVISDAVSDYNDGQHMSNQMNQWDNNWDFNQHWYDEYPDDQEPRPQPEESLFNFLGEYFKNNQNDTTCIVLVYHKNSKKTIKYMFIKKEENNGINEYRYYYKAEPNHSNSNSNKLNILNVTSESGNNYSIIDNNYGNETTSEKYEVVGPNYFNEEEQEQTEIINVLKPELEKYRVRKGEREELMETIGGVKLIKRRNTFKTLKSFLTDVTGFSPQMFDGGMRRKRNNIYKKNNKMTKRKRRATINKQKRAAAAKTTRKRRTTIKKRKCGAASKRTRKRRATSIKLRQRKTKKNYK